MSRAPKTHSTSTPQALCVKWAPWMEIAWSQQGIKLEPPATFITQLRDAIQMEQRLQAIQPLKLSSSVTSASQRTVSLFGPKDTSGPRLRDPVPGLLAEWQRSSLADNNPNIVKYFQGLKTDPSLNKRGKSYGIEATQIDKSGTGAYVNAWCAAFVNWCLKEAGAPHLNYATAHSWLRFGTEVSFPVYGCIAIIKPQSSTGGGTGHVAFFVGRKGSNVQLLGGNQSKQVKVSDWNEQRNVVGYRWPTSVDDYLAGGGRPSCALPEWAK